MFGRSLWSRNSARLPTPLNEQSEEQLLSAAMAYDEAALGELYDRYETKIYTYIYRRTGDEVLAEDMTAQVFMKMLQAIREEKAWHSSFSGWLYRIAHNLVIDNATVMVTCHSMTIPHYLTKTTTQWKTSPPKWKPNRYVLPCVN